jgi:hypothetical protein
MSGMEHIAEGESVISQGSDSGLSYPHSESNAALSDILEKLTKRGWCANDLPKNESDALWSEIRDELKLSLSQLACLKNYVLNKLGMKHFTVPATSCKNSPNLIAGLDILDRRAFPLQDLPKSESDPLWNDIRAELNLSLGQLAALKCYALSQSPSRFHCFSVVTAENDSDKCHDTPGTPRSACTAASNVGVPVVESTPVLSTIEEYSDNAVNIDVLCVRKTFFEACVLEFVGNTVRIVYENQAWVQGRLESGS